MGDHVSRSAFGVYLTITESVSPFAVGKYEGPSFEVYFYKAYWNRRKILDDYKKEVLYFMDEADVLEESYYNQISINSYESLLNEIFSFSYNDNTIQ